MKRQTYHVLLVEVDERKRERDVKGARLVRVGGTFARLESDHEIDPSRWTLRLERLDEVDAEDFSQQLLELCIDSCTHNDASKMQQLREQK